MSIKWGSTLVPESTLIKRGNTVVDKIYRGNNLLWTYQYAPSAITDFSASVHSGINQITVTFSGADARPACTYNLINASTGATLATNISSGYVYSTTSYALNLKVRAINSVGSTDSNTSTGKTKAPAGSRTFTSSGTFTTPRGYTSLTVCMIGGGGGGQKSAYTGASKSIGGGYRGTIKNQSTTVSATPASLSVVCGAGGAGRASNGNGLSGASSTFNGITAGGGAGGNGSAYHGNNILAPANCYGTYRDGTKGYHGGSASHTWGGQAGFGNGGSGVNISVGTAGGAGAGGGGSFGTSGAGGRGVVKISWS